MNYEYFNRSFILFSCENDWICYLFTFAKRLQIFKTENYNNHSLVFHLKFIKSIINEYILTPLHPFKRTFNHFENEERKKWKPKLFYSKYYFGAHLSTNSFKRFILPIKMQWDLVEQQQMVKRFDIGLPTNKMLKSRNNNLFPRMHHSQYLKNCLTTNIPKTKKKRSVHENDWFESTRDLHDFSSFFLRFWRGKQSFLSYSNQTNGSVTDNTFLWKSFHINWKKKKQNTNQK